MQENSYLVDGPLSAFFRNRLVAQDGRKDNSAAFSWGLYDFRV